LVLVEWQDSFGCSADWQPVENVRAKPLVCRSVGWLAYDGKDCKVIVPHLSVAPEASQHGCGEMTIPTKAIISIKTLDRGKQCS
jgi:hypothetical protein